MGRPLKVKPPHVVSVDMDKLSDALLKTRGSQSLRDYARTIGVTFSTISRVEHGAQPDLLTYVALCDALGVSLDTFLIRWKVVKP